MTKPKPKREVFCIGCGAFAGWIEGRGRRPLRCWPCYQVHLRDYNAQAKRMERFKDVNVPYPFATAAAYVAQICPERDSKAWERSLKAAVTGGRLAAANADSGLQLTAVGLMIWMARERKRIIPKEMIARALAKQAAKGKRR